MWTLQTTAAWGHHVGTSSQLCVILYVRESKGAGQRQSGALAFNTAQTGTLKEALARSIKGS